MSERIEPFVVHNVCSIRLYHRARCRRRCQALMSTRFERLTSLPSFNLLVVTTYLSILRLNSQAQVTWHPRVLLMTKRRRQTGASDDADDEREWLEGTRRDTVKREVRRTDTRTVTSCVCVQCVHTAPTSAATRGLNSSTKPIVPLMTLTASSSRPDRRQYVSDVTAKKTCPN